jgi:hypothetical protein
MTTNFDDSAVGWRKERWNVLQEKSVNAMKFP